MTTGVERDGSTTPKNTTKSSDPVSQVGGALWLVDAGCNAGDAPPCPGRPNATLLETFVHKPDGVTHDDGSVLIVFDDEAWRKSIQWAPRTFPLAQNESVFAVVPSPELK